MIVGILGYIGCGKGTVASYLVEKYNFRQDSFASSLKDACAALFDWPRHLLEGDTRESREWREQVDTWWSGELGIPGLSPRLALQLMGTDVIRNHFNQNMWFLTIKNRMRKNPDQHVVISDVRFPNEIEFIKQSGGILIQVERGDNPAWIETAIMANRGNTVAKEIMQKTYSSAHFSEWAWAGATVDNKLQNNSSIEDLHLQIDEVIKTTT